MECGISNVEFKAVGHERSLKRGPTAARSRCVYLVTDVSCGALCSAPPFVGVRSPNAAHHVPTSGGVEQSGASTEALCHVSVRRGGRPTPPVELSAFSSGFERTI